VAVNEHVSLLATDTGELIVWGEAIVGTGVAVRYGVRWPEGDARMTATAAAAALSCFDFDPFHLI
jgi:hypothetical protein